MSDYGICTTPKLADLEKDPDSTIRVPFYWAADLGSDTISTSTFTLPDGLTNAADDQTGSVTTIDLSGGVDGSTYRVTNRIVTAGGLTLDKTQRVLVREQ